jgi:hypothetical protein
MPYIGNPIYQSAFVVDQFSGNGSTTAFTMSVAPAGVTNVLVAVSGVLQDPSTYGVVGNTITFSAAPPSGTGNISCRYLGVPVTGVTTTAYRTVTEFTATASQTTFTPPSYTVGFINVYLNGVLLGSADYTATNGTTVVLATGASAGNLVTVESFLVSSVLNAIPNTAGAVSSANIANDVIINFADGSASTPSITNNGDTNTGIYFPAADTIAFTEGGTESMRITSTGIVDIGGTSGGSAGELLVVEGANSAGHRAARINNTSTTNGYSTLWMGSSNDGLIRAGSTAGSFTDQLLLLTSGAIPISFYTANTERMRIDSSGSLLVGTTTNYGSATSSMRSGGTVLGLYCSGGSGQPALVIGKESNDGSTSQVLMQFLYNNGSAGLGQINGNGGSQAAFGSYSDIRLKENVTNLPSQLSNIMALRPVEFDWKDGTGHQIGFIAQEVNEIYPDLVGENANGMLTLTDMNKNDARLIKCIQEQQTLITALTARVAALEAK